MTEYLIFSLRKDKRYKNGYRPNSFRYIGGADTYTDAQNKAKQAQKSGYYIGIEERRTVC